MRYDFTGAFARYICGLIAQKRAFGFDYLESERILYMFERFCQEQFPIQMSAAFWIGSQFRGNAHLKL